MESVPLRGRGHNSQECAGESNLEQSEDAEEGWQTGSEVMESNLLKTGLPGHSDPCCTYSFNKMLSILLTPPIKEMRHCPEGVRRLELVVEGDGRWIPSVGVPFTWDGRRP